MCARTGDEPSIDSDEARQARRDCASLRLACTATRCELSCLCALGRVGASVPVIASALSSAAWELDRRIIAVAGDDWQSCGAWVIGRRVTLTLAERMTLGIRTMWPADKTRAAVKQAYRAQAPTGSGPQTPDWAQKRENARMNHDLSERQETLFALLRGNGKWMTVRQLAAAVRKWSAWKRPDGRAQKIASLRVLVRTELVMRSGAKA